MLSDPANLERGGQLRPRVHGRFFRVGRRPFYVKGVTYGTFAPAADGSQFPPRERVERDFELMASHGFNAVRLYTPPREEMLDQAARHGLALMIGLPWTQHVAFLENPEQARSIRQDLAGAVRRLAGHPAALLFALGNEIPPGIVRWHGARRVERFLSELADAAHQSAPEACLAYVNYPPTEFLEPRGFDLCAFNVYLHDRANLRAYLARLQHVAGQQPFLLAEAGADSLREGESGQAAITAMHVREGFAAGACGVFAYAWTDEWWRGGESVRNWRFGLVDEERRPKPALGSVADAFAEAPFPAPERASWPRVSVVVCAYNAADTLRDCLDSLRELDYPDFEVIVVDDGSRDQTLAIARGYASDDRFRILPLPANGGLSAARNAGLAQATGEIVAYTDADVRVNPEWLSYLVQPFADPEVVGSGGPNVVPPDDPWVAQCVARAPGGPTQVMLDDRTAEHVPGCNMAFRRQHLLAIGGFNPIFLRAGDDVDACWRLQARGWRIGFAPAAVVWHHHRSTVRAYWRQQVGYGEGEVWLAPHHPDKFEGRQMLWRGRLYSPLPYVRSLTETRVNAGVWGTAPFPSVYRTDARALAYLPHTVAWQGAVLALFTAGAAAAVAGQFGWAALAAAVGGMLLATTVAKCCLYADATDISGLSPIGGLSPGASARRYRWMIAWLHFLQPLARLRGRVRGLFSPPAVDGAEPAPRLPESRNLPGLAEFGDAARLFMLRTPSRRFWGEQWASAEELLKGITLAIRRSRQVPSIAVDDGWVLDRDLSVGLGPWAWVDLRVAVEEHERGRILARVASRLRLSGLGRSALAGLVGTLALAIATDSAGRLPLLTAVTMAVALALTGVAFGRLVHASSTLRRAVDRATASAGMIPLPGEPRVRERGAGLGRGLRSAWALGLLALVLGAGFGLLRSSLPAAADQVVRGQVSVSELPWAPPAVELQSPGGIAIAANGDVYYADSVHDVIRRLDSRGRVEALSATLGRVVERPRGMTPFDAPGGMALAPDGGLIIADSEHDRVLRLDLATGLLSVVAGVGERGFGGDGGPAMEALFDTPTAVAAAPNGDLYVADTGNHRVRKVEAASGLVSTFAGNGETGDVWSVGDWGPAVEATLDGPSDVALGPEGEVYIADMRHNRVRRVGPEGEITTVAGCGAFAAWGDGWPAPTAALAGPAGIAVAAGRDGVTLYIADYYNGRVRMVGPDGAMRTLQGSRVKAFDAPTRVAWSPRGWLYVADATRNRVTVVRAPRAAPG